MNSLWVIQDFLSPSSFNGPSCNIEPFSSWFLTKRDEKKHLLFRSGFLPFWMVLALNRAFVALGVSRWELKVKRTRKKRKRSSQVPSLEPLTFYILFNNKIKFNGSISLVNYNNSNHTELIKEILNYSNNDEKIISYQEQQQSEEEVIALWRINKYSIKSISARTQIPKEIVNKILSKYRRLVKQQCNENKKKRSGKRFVVSPEHIMKIKDYLDYNEHRPICARDVIKAVWAPQNNKCSPSDSTIYSILKKEFKMSYRLLEKKNEVCWSSWDKKIYSGIFVTIKAVKRQHWNNLCGWIFFFFKKIENIVDGFQEARKHSLRNVLLTLIWRSCLPFQVKIFTALWLIKEQTIKIYLSSFSIHYWSQENSVWKEVGNKFWIIADNS